MTQVENETEEDVDYIVEDEETRTKEVFRRLKAGRTVDLKVSGDQFGIAFYRRGKSFDLMAQKEEISKDDDLRLYCSEQDTWTVEIKTAARST